MLIAIALVAGACFGAAVYGALVAVGAKARCGDCAAWKQLAEIRALRTADLERQREALIADAVARLDEYEW